MVASTPFAIPTRRSHKKNGSYATLHEACEAYDRVARDEGLPVNVPKTILEAIRSLIAAVLFYGTRGGGVWVGSAASSPRVDAADDPRRRGVDPTSPKVWSSRGPALAEALF